MDPCDKDNNTILSKWLFGLLAVLTALTLVVGLYNVVLFAKHGRFKNISLAAFYFFAILSLSCKFLSITLQLCSSTSWI
jgi:hypothetical protein